MKCVCRFWKRYKAVKGSEGSTLKLDTTDKIAAKIFALRKYIIMKF